MSMHHWEFQSSHSSITATVEHGGYYSCSRWCAVWSVIKFIKAQSIALIEIHRQLCQIYVPNVMSKQMVSRWWRQFTAGRQYVHEECGGRPSIIMDNLVELVWECIMENHRFAIMELSSHFPLLVSQKCHGAPVVQKIVCHVGTTASDIRTQSKDNGNEFLDWIGTGDAHNIPQIKLQSIHWHHSGSSCKTKFKQTLSAWKVMYTVFWDRWGILLIDFLTRGEMVNAECYCKTLQKLWRAIQNKRCGMHSARVILLQENARPRPHMARWATHLLQEFSWEVFNHPLYSLHLAPSDFHLFLHLKKFLSGQSQWCQNDRCGDECHTVVPIPGSRLLWQKDTRVGPTVWEMSQFRRYVEK